MTRVRYGEPPNASRTAELEPQRFRLLSIIVLSAGFEKVINLVDLRESLSPVALPRRHAFSFDLRCIIQQPTAR